MYSAGKSEEKIISPVNWEEEFALYKKYNLKRIAKKGDLIFDTVFDQRTNRYLIRGMRLEVGPGAQSLYLVLDSQRNMLQFRLSEKEKSWLKNTEKELFWDVQGEFSYNEQSKYTFSSNQDIQIFGTWE